MNHNAPRPHAERPAGFPPVCDPNSRVLILGTWPSPASFAAGFYYGHPQNRFWRLMARLLDAPLPATTGEKTTLLLSNGVALWDVLEHCDITGAADSSIRRPVPNDLSGLLERCPIRAVATNGAKAAQLYARFWGTRVALPHLRLPSTSPANAAFGPDALAARWAGLLEFLPRRER